MAHDSSVSRVSRQIFIKGCRPLRGLELVSDDVPGVRCAHPGLYAIVRSADFLTSFSDHRFPIDPGEAVIERSAFTSFMTSSAEV